MHDEPSFNKNINQFHLVISNLVQILGQIFGTPIISHRLIKYSLTTTSAINSTHF